MIVKTAHIKNYRSLRDVKITFGKQTAIVGANGAGKSTILKALDRFYGPSTQVALDDFHNRNVDQPIEIALTFINFSPEEMQTFGSRIIDGEMTVVRVFDVKGGKQSGRYFGMTSGHTGFSVIRSSENATAQRTAYNALRASDTTLYGTLAQVTKAGDIETQLTAWEEVNSDKCEMVRDDGQFLGFTNVGNGSLKKSTSFVFIPAVRDAALDALDGRGSAIAKLMELVVRNVIQKRAEIQTWQASVTQQYRELTDPANLTELEVLASDLTKTLKTLYDDTAVELTWKPSGDFEIPLPTAVVALDDAGFPAPVELQGNGLQRAFILTLLQHLAMAVLRDSESSESGPSEPSVIPLTMGNAPLVPIVPGLILAIEEPELYQHPTKQRHFAKVLSQLSEGSLPGVATKTQVIFASHSPYFVCMDRFDQVKVARRSPGLQGLSKECLMKEAELQKVVDLLVHAHQPSGVTWTTESLKNKLHIVTSEVSEGFFADAVLLVEGESDRAAIKASAIQQGVDLEAMGIAVLQAGGKTCLDRPAAIFKALAIPTFVVWDSDHKPTGLKDQDERMNRALQRLLGVADSDSVASGTRVHPECAFFKDRLENTLRDEFGAEAFDAALLEAQESFDVKEKNDAIKASPVMRSVFEKLSANGATSPTLEKIVVHVVALRGFAIGSANKANT